MPTPAMKEMVLGRTTSGKSAQRQYQLTGYADDIAALAALLGGSPATVNGLPRVDTDCQVEETANVMGQLIYTGMAKYQSADFGGGNQAGAVGEFEISFDIGSTTVNLKQSWSTRHKYTASGHKQRDFKGAINVDGDGTIGGVDVNAPVLGYTMSQFYSVGAVNQAFIANLKNCVGKVNGNAYLGHSIGELLLGSVTGSLVTDDKWKLTFKFGSQKNETGITVDAITGIEKYGWEYLWAFYEEVKETVDGVKFTRRKATNVYIEQVYKLTDYSVLGINFV